MADAMTESGPEFPMRKTCPLHPPREYAELRDRRPICRVTLPTGVSAWLVTRHDHVRRLLADPHVSTDRTQPGFPLLRPAADRTNPVLLGTDPPEHTWHRRMVLGDFTVKRVARMRPRIQEIVDTHVDALLAGDRPADLVRALALPVPSLAICELLGVPYADRAVFQRNTTALSGQGDGVEARRAASEALDAYLDHLVAGHEADPGEDLLGRLIVKYREAGCYDHDWLVRLGRVLLMAGHETTANMISLGVVGLLENPGQLEALRGAPELWPRAVDELLRFFSIVDHGTTRVATADIEIGGERIREGEGMILVLGSADRDGGVFADPDRLDIHRNARPHVAFGYGPHQCVGQHLAHAELEIVLRTLFERVPALRLAESVDRLPFKPATGVYGLHALPVTW
ncbi:MAG TPA: cytochrome P450 [Streptosporangiaceae bacterium]|jgi:cytochrome P450